MVGRSTFAGQGIKGRSPAGAAKAEAPSMSPAVKRLYRNMNVPYLTGQIQAKHSVNMRSNCRQANAPTEITGC